MKWISRKELNFMSFFLASLGSELKEREIKNKRSPFSMLNLSNSYQDVQANKMNWERKEAKKKCSKDFDQS